MTSRNHEIARRDPPGSRLKAHAGLKLAALGIFGAVFFAGYFLLLKLPVFPVTNMPVTALDRLIAFRPGALLLYVSLWIYIPLVPGLMNRKAEIIAFYQAAGALCLVGFAVFFFWPTSVPPLGLDWTDHAAFSRLKAADGSGNACPSLHVTFAVFCALLLHRRLGQMGDRGMARSLSWAWCAGIVYSTLATKQHVALDVYAGAALGAAGAMLYLRSQARSSRPVRLIWKQPSVAGAIRVETAEKIRDQAR
jgi:membrane-associated phospholipid phosphatase